MSDNFFTIEEIVRYRNHFLKTLSILRKGMSEEKYFEILNELNKEIDYMKSKLKKQVKKNENIICM